MAITKRTVEFRPMSIPEMKDAAARVIDSEHYIRTSPDEESEGKSFEEEFSEFLSDGIPDGRRPHVANLANGTAAMHLAWVAYDIGPGDEVIIPANTFVSVAHCVSLTGADPVFADVEWDIYNLDPESVAEKITDRTRAIMPVHAAGHPANIGPILELAKKHNLIVVEDACQGIAGKYKGQYNGTLGDMGCFSFVKGKSLNCGGEGGAVVSFDKDRVRRVFDLANHARGPEFQDGRITGEIYRGSPHLNEPGYNYRQSEILSAMVRTQLPYLPEWLERRRHLADLYRQLVADAELPIELPAEREWATHSYVRFEVRVGPERDALKQYLAENGIGTSVHYPVPIHLDTYYQAKYGVPEGSLPVSERLAQEIMTMPLYPQMSDDDVEYVVHHMKNFFAAKRSA